MELLYFAGMNSLPVVILLISLMSAVVFPSCKFRSGLTKEEFEKLQANVSGNWINQQWFDTLQQHGYPSAARHLPCLEIIVSRQLDSLAWIEPDQEIQTYPIKLLSDSSFSVLSNRRPLLFYYSTGYRTLIMDEDNQKLVLKKLPHRYAIVAVHRWMSGLMPFINENLIAGTYRLVDQADSLPPPHTILTAYGEVAHLAGYKNYKLCISADCFRNSSYDILILSDERSTDRYIWQWKSDTLQLYSVINTGSLQNPVFIPHEVIFNLIKTH